VAWPACQDCDDAVKFIQDRGGCSDTKVSQ
jgi:hypothetical protein